MMFPYAHWDTADLTFNYHKLAVLKIPSCSFFKQTQFTGHLSLPINFFSKRMYSSDKAGISLNP